MKTAIPQPAVEAAAAAIANARAMRRGSPPVSTVLELLKASPRLQKLHDEVMEDAECALDAAGVAELLAACKQAIHALKGREHTGFLESAIAKAEGR
jgi:hypothetical protein